MIDWATEVAVITTWNRVKSFVIKLKTILRNPRKIWPADFQEYVEVVKHGNFKILLKKSPKVKF